ncbi:phage tail tape measure protein [Thioflexithrix psekupsensis]|uniref:Uncharacterized protein n=1 Tax=Thioflexithrix psekupsensis TaxID=1570016 RepID=A0A251X3S1_9GAMM|nr:phage tail tape measure protein [Thioflexithrix psekupsensis]OUD12036.1 hypothetical protein TPSD3_12935 [Thioflexithrix psekupsensis]
MDIGKKLLAIFQWVVSIIVALFGLLLLISSSMGGFLILLSSAALMPPVAEKLVKLPKRKWLFPVLLVSGFVVAVSTTHEGPAKRDEAQLAQETAERAEKVRQAELQAKAELELKRAQFIEQRDVIVSELNSLLEIENYQAIIDKGSIYSDLDEEVALLVNKAQGILAERAESERLEREAAEKEAQSQKLLSELDALPKTDTQGHLTRYKQLLQLSPDNTSYQQKLDHFQKVIEAERQKYEAEEQKARALRALKNKWNFATDKSSLDDSVNVYMHVAASNTIQGTLNQPVRPKLWIRCSENTTSIFIDWDVYINIRETPMIYRVDSQKQNKKSFSISTDHKALGYFSGGQSIPFIKSLFGANK